MKLKEAVAVFDGRIKDGQVPDRRRPGRMHRISRQRRDVIISHVRNAVARAADVDRDDLRAIDEVELDPIMATLPSKAYQDARASGRSSPRNERTNVALFGATVEGREYETSTRHGYANRRPVTRSTFLPAWQPLYDVLLADALNLDGTPNQRRSYPAQLLAMQNLLLEQLGVHSPHDIADDYHAFVRIAEAAGVAYKKRHAMLAALRRARDLLNDETIPPLYMGAHATQLGLGSLPDLAERLAAHGCDRDPRRMRQEELVGVLVPTMHAALERRLAEGKRRNRRPGWFDDQIGMTSRIAASLLRLGYDVGQLTYVDLWTTFVQVEASNTRDGVDPVLAAVMGEHYVHVEERSLMRVLADEMTRRSYVNSPLQVVSGSEASDDQVPLYTQRVIQDVKNCYTLVKDVFGPALSKHKRDTWVAIQSEYTSLIECMDSFNEDAHTINHKRKSDVSMLWPQAVCLFLPWLMKRVEDARRRLADIACRGGREGSRTHRKHMLAFDEALKEYVLAALMLDDGLRIKNYAGALAGKHVIATPERDSKKRWVRLVAVETRFCGINDHPSVTLKVAKDELGAERIRHRRVTPGIVRHDYLFEYWTGTRARDLVRRGFLKSVEAFDPDADDFAFFVSPRRGGRKSAKKPREAYSARHGCFTEDYLSNVFGRRFHYFIREVLGQPVPAWEDPERTTKWRGMFTAHVIRLLLGTYFGGILGDWATACYITDDTERTLRRNYNRVGDRINALRHVVGVQNPHHFDNDEANPPRKPGERPDALWWEWLYRSGATTYTEGVRLRPGDIKEGEESQGTVPVWLHGSKQEARKRHVYPPTEFCEQLLNRAEQMGYKRDSARAIFKFTEDTGRWWWDRLLRFIGERDPSLANELEGATPYDLRHSFAILHLEGGVDIYDVMRLMGHSSIETTAIYLRRRQPDRARIRAAASRLDELRRP